MVYNSICKSAATQKRVLGRSAVARFLLPMAAAGLISLSGCASLSCSKNRDEEELSKYIQAQIEMLPNPGIHEVRACAAAGHVTIGGRVDSPATLKEIVRAVANTPGLTQLSFFGVEFAPPEISDDEIVVNARATAEEAIGTELASQLGYYCEDHRLFVYGKLPSLAIREKLDEAVRELPGVGLYHVSCEVVLENPPSDVQVVKSVRRKFRKPFDLPNLAFRAGQVEVGSVNNVVVLTGKAPTFLGKLSAGVQASQVDGVRYVVNRIVVPGLNQPSKPDAQHAAEPTESDGEITQAVLLLQTEDPVRDENAGQVIEAILIQSL